MKKYVLIGEKQFWTKDEWYGDIYTCPNCKDTDIWSNFSFCPKCGIKLHWRKK